MLRKRLDPFGISLFTYCITSNHTHLLLRARDDTTESVSRFMQSLEGDFAQYYNLRKRRFGAFWWDRYHAVMIQDGRHLWRCLKYIDLNMVRAGVVSHPSEWEWTGYRELMGERRRNRLIDLPMLCRVLELDQPDGIDGFRQQYRLAIEEAIARRELKRQSVWTESIAVGDQEWADALGGRIRNRRRVVVEEDADDPGLWCVREQHPGYSSMEQSSGPKIAP